MKGIFDWGPSDPDDIESSQGNKQRRLSRSLYNFFSQTHLDDGVRIISFQDRSHFSVMTQMYGSVWPHVVIYCLVNVGLTSFLWYLQKYRGIELSVDPAGHKLTGTLTSFVMIGKLKSIYSRYMEARSHLTDIFRSCREMIHYTCILTMHDQSDEAKAWRRDIAYRIIILLQVTISSLGEASSKETPWELEYLDTTARESLLFLQSMRDSMKKRFENYSLIRKYEILRAPMAMLFDLRKAILDQRFNEQLHQRLFHRHPCNEELKILSYASSYIAAYQELIKLADTPYPFPLIQMGRTFLFLWVFTIPFAMLHNKYDFHELLVMIFLLTFGFCGIERVCTEMDDPFGDDPCDFDDMNLAQIVFEDIYITLVKCDGLKPTLLLRKKVKQTPSSLKQRRNPFTEYGTL